MESDDMEADTLPPDPLRVEESLVPLLTKLRIQTTEQKGLIGGGVALVRPPRWKKYEKAKHTMTWMDKRRLDNIIWRAWHLHYMMGRKTRYIDFAEEAPEQEAKSMSYPILEGENNQETVKTITSGYLSWRKFWKNRISQAKEKQAAASGDVDMLMADPMFAQTLSDQMFLDAWNLNDFELGNINDLMDTIPDTLFSTLPMAQQRDTGLMDLDSVMPKEYTQPKNVSNLLRSSTSASYHDFLSAQLIDQQLFPGLHVAHTKPIDLSAVQQQQQDGGSRRNTQIERTRRQAESRAAPYGQPRPKTWKGESVPDSMDKLGMEQPTSQLRSNRSFASSQPATPEGMTSRLSSQELIKTQGDVRAQPYGSNGVKVEAGGQDGSRERVDWFVGGESSEEEEGHDDYDEAAMTHAEAKRTAHILAEQKRRNNIRMGFEELSHAIPTLQVRAPNQKVSKAMILQRSIEHIQLLEMQRYQLAEEANRLRAEINMLQISMSQLQNVGGLRQPDADSVPASRMYHDYIQSNANNIKFFVFHTMFECLLEGFVQTVQVDRPEAMGMSFTTWFIHNCTNQQLKECASMAVHKLSQRLYASSQPVMGQQQVGFQFDAATAAALATFAQAQAPPLSMGPPPLPPQALPAHLVTPQMHPIVPPAPTPLTMQMPFALPTVPPPPPVAAPQGMHVRSISYPSLQQATIPRVASAGMLQAIRPSQQQRPPTYR